MPYQNGDLTNSQLPTTDQVRRYLRLINQQPKNGVQRDARPYMSFLQRLLEIDQYLFGLIQTRKLAVKSYPYTIKLNTELKLSAAEDKRLADTKIRFKRSRMHDNTDDIMDAVMFGMSAVRLTFDNTFYGTMPVEKYIYDLTDLDFSDETDGLVEYDQIGKIVKTELDPDIHLLARYNPFKNRKNYIGSIVRAVSLLSFLKYNTRWDWKDLNTRHGNPSTYAMHPEGIDEADVTKLIAMVEKLKNDSVAVFPDYVKIAYDEALKSQNKESFKEFIEAANTEMAIAIHGQNLTTEVQSGSLAAANVHNQIDDLIIQSDLKFVESVFNDYLRKDYQLNYGENPEIDFFEFQFIHEEQEDYESNSRIIANIFSDPNLKSNLPIKKEELYKKIGFTMPADGDETV